MIEQARWITAPGCEGVKNCAFRAWRDFELGERPESLLLEIAAECNYILYINALRIGNGPARGSSGVNYFDTWEIAPFVHEGRNHVAIVVWSPGKDNFVAAPTAAPVLRMTIGDMVFSDCSFKAWRAPDWLPAEQLFNLQTGFMEDRDLRLAPDDMQWLFGIDVGEWPVAKIADDPMLAAKRLAPRAIPPLRENAVEPVSLAVVRGVKMALPNMNESHAQTLDRSERQFLPDDSLKMVGETLILYPGTGLATELVYDFGQDRIGFPEICIEGARGGETVLVSFGEHLEKDRVQTTYVLGSTYYFTDRYILRPGGNRIGSILRERGFRYMQLVIYGMTSPLRIQKVGLLEHRYPVRNRGEFFCDDWMLNRLWEVARETMSLCMTDIFIDCPWRERAFWVNDLVVENCTSLELFGSEAIHRRAFDLLFSQQQEDGWVPGVCPAPRGTGLQLVLPPANLFLFQIFDEYLLYSGDFDTVLQWLPRLEKILSAVERTRDADGLVSAPQGSWNFYDWAFEFSDVCFRDQRESMFNFLYVNALELFLKLNRLTRREIDEGFYRNCRDRVGSAALRIFVGKDGRLHDPCGFYEPQFQPSGATRPPVVSQLAHAFALLSGAVPESLWSGFSAVLNDPEAMMPDYYLHFFVLRELVKTGQAAAALERIRKYWRRSLETGDRTLCEIGIVDFGKKACWGAGSLCHGFTTAPVDFLQTTVLGIKPLQPGFAEFRVDIHCFDLEFARGRVPTPIIIQEKRLSANPHILFFIFISSSISIL